MMSNLEIIEWKKFRGQPKLEDAAESNLEFFEFKYFQIGQAELIRYCQQGYYPLIFTNCSVKD